MDISSNIEVAVRCEGCHTAEGPFLINHVAEIPFLINHVAEIPFLINHVAEIPFLINKVTGHDASERP